MSLRTGALLLAGVSLLLISLVAPSGTSGMVIQNLPSTTEHTHTVVPNDLRPEECISSSIEVSQIGSGGSPLIGSADSDLLLADPTTATVSGDSGTDCIVGSTATAHIDGGPDHDLCIGPLTMLPEAFENCEEIVRR